MAQGGDDLPPYSILICSYNHEVMHNEKFAGALPSKLFH